MRHSSVRRRSGTTGLYGVIAVVFVIIAIACLVYRSNIIPKMVTAATIGDESYTAAEVNYYFVNNYQNFLSQNYNYISYMGLDVSSDLRDQEYSDGETWFDFFMDQTLQQMAEVQAHEPMPPQRTVSPGTMTCRLSWMKT